MNAAIPNKDILIPGYQPPVRKDRPTRGGGVAIYVKSDIYFTHVNALDIRLRSDMDTNFN